MTRRTIFDRRQLILLLWLLLSSGFVAISVIGYQVSKRALREALIVQDLPLTSSNIYAEIQKDLVRPVLISSTMAHDTFVRDWVLGGERDIDAMTRYLREVKVRHGAFSSFFVSDKSGQYYVGEGILKRIARDEPRDAWYYRVKTMREDYEINVDPDLANQDALTIFINYRVHDYAGHYIGATGIGLTVDAVSKLLIDYQRRFNRTIYFVDQSGQVVSIGNAYKRNTDLRQEPGLGPLVDRILRDRRGSYQFIAGGDNHILHVNYLPELKWYLFVEQNETVALKDIRHTLYTNLAISVVVTLIVIILIHLALMRYQRRIEDMASTDKLTGLLNRHAFTILIDKMMAEHRRDPKPISLLIADLDHFKAVNDQYGHLAGDTTLKHVADSLRDGLRESDMAVRWGGEEFLMVLKGCTLDEAMRIAEKLRQAVESSQIQVNGKTIQVTISLGASQFDGREPPDQTVNRADTALYEAKRAGRNRVVAGR